MSKVLFSIKYEIIPDKRENYLDLIRELKTLIKADGLESYSVFELKGKANHFEELYVFESREAYEEFDDDPNERVNILMNKLTDMIVQQSTQYSTLFEI
ncbi:MAG: hypothetical protein CVV23_04010 [Ignavibacteriae bacterium HGW-Ignavibacteriae-2]|jgi:quinol monooxygenase YgiN|nr:hypothetical protein [Bacteroidota bacterium]PKL89644.1 MAG: hypothetical protein CVV23_04010 [Ignavibacteriae bacterium HGW-Ignavibacteriae-2]